jgi:cell division topological specificity factor
MGIFTDFYNTVAKFFRPQEEQQGDDASKSVATNRLKLVLMQDRTNLTPKVLEQMRGELVDLLSKYLEMDKDLLELNFEQEGDQVALMLSIPVIRAKDEDEIEEALKSNSTEDNSDDEEDDEDNDESEEDNSDNDENEDVAGSTDEGTEKPKRKYSKKVTQPETMENNSTADEEPAQAEEIQS